jgi:hypothetical protein
MTSPHPSVSRNFPRIRNQTNPENPKTMQPAPHHCRRGETSSSELLFSGGEKMSKNATEDPNLVEHQ